MLKELDFIRVDRRRYIRQQRKGRIDIAKLGRVGSYNRYNKLKL
jgi:hypothetical protein